MFPILQSVPASVQMPSPPPRVQAAQQFLQFIADVEFRRGGGTYGMESGDCPHSVGDLTIEEKAARSAAITVLMLYFQGEMDYGDCPPVVIRPEDEPPEKRVPATAK